VSEAVVVTGVLGLLGRLLYDGCLGGEDCSPRNALTG
jgi:hypothetical protein